MRMHELRPGSGSRKERKRVGRGNASGQGTTAGKGTKGQKARSGGFKAGFRGMSSRNQRMAKRRGFTNVFKVEHQLVTLEQLEHLEPATIVNSALLKHVDLIRHADKPVKILATGELTKALNVEGVKMSAAAREKIEAVGGSVTWEQPDATGEDSGVTGSA